MPKLMLHQQVKQEQGNILSASYQPEQKLQNTKIDKMKLDRLLRKPRSPQYIKMVQNLDVGDHTLNKNQVASIIGAISNEFPEIELKGVLLGFVAVCYLGNPYEVHILDFSGQIIEHYKKGQVLPYGMEKARALALHGGYSFIEVYVDCCRAISANGTVSVIPC